MLGKKPHQLSFAEPSAETDYFRYWSGHHLDRGFARQGGIRIEGTVDGKYDSRGGGGGAGCDWGKRKSELPDFAG